MHTVDINAKEYRNKTYGNSYFSARVTIDYQLPEEQVIMIPFQYGYDSHYVHVSLQKIGLTPQKIQEQEIILRGHIQRNCTKKDVINFGKQENSL